MLQVPAIRPSNPVLWKELRTRIRGNRAYWLLFWYVMLLSIVLFCAYFFKQRMALKQPIEIYADPVGRDLFEVLSVTQAALLTIVTPTLTAGMVTIEREQRTLDLLMLTLLRPREIAEGKLLSAFGFAALLLTASLPLAGICFMLGGISPGEIAVTYLMLAGATLFCGALGLLVSAMARTTVISTAATYMAVLALGLCMGVTIVSSTMDARLFAGFNPMFAVFFGPEQTTFYRWHVPNWIPSLVLTLLAALLATAGAAHKLEAGVSECPGALRWLTWTFFTAMAFCCIGSILGGVPQSTSVEELREAAAILGGTLFLALALLALFFCTGDATEIYGEVPAREAGVSRGPLTRFARSWLFTGGYASGPAYILFLFLTGAIVIVTGFPLAGHTDWVQITGIILAALGVALSGTLLWIAMARFFSVVRGNRLQAGIFTYVTLGVALILLPLLNTDAWKGPAHQPGILAWTLYLNPGCAFFALGSTPEAWKKVDLSLPAGQNSTWVFTFFLYMGLAAIIEVWGQARRRQERARRKVPARAE